MKKRRRDVMNYSHDITPMIQCLWDSRHYMGILLDKTKLGSIINGEVNV